MFVYLFQQMSPKSMAMILNITETIHKLKMPFDRGCSMRLYNNNNMRKLHHPNNSNLKLPCPTVSQIFLNVQ